VIKANDTEYQLPPYTKKIPLTLSAEDSNVNSDDEKQEFDVRMIGP
jgi:hypothetical protein